MSAQNQVVEVPFHETPLQTLLVEGVPHVVMRPLVEALGLSWPAQYTKLTGNRVRYASCDIATRRSDGQTTNMLCVPVSKINAWLYSINPERVSPELKDKVIAYQEECSNVLNQYWRYGVAINPRFRPEKTRIAHEGCLTLEQQTEIKLMVKEYAETLPLVERRKATLVLWAALKAKFQVPYKEIPATEFTDALSLLARLITQ